MNAPALRVLMICMGNICRSPTAAGVLRERLRQAGLAAQVEVDSAGTHAHWHAGEQADARARKHALARGYDLILAMDWDNIAALEARCPPDRRDRLRRLSEFGRAHASEVVPDPYYAGPAAFDHVLDLVEDACDGVVEHLRRQL
jgi:protein-tyrosine phosphatase